MQETAKRCFDRVIEIDKARVTINLFLALTTVTLTGYALQNKKAEIFFVAAFIPFFCLFVDSVLRYVYITPFLYKAFAADFQIAGDGSEILLFLHYPLQQPSPYVVALQLPSEAKRQRAFRRLYIGRFMSLRIFFFGAITAVEVALGIFLT